MKKLLHSCRCISLVFLHKLQKDQLWLDCTDHRGVTFLGTFTHSFSDIANVFFPLWHTIQQPITFGIVIPDKTAKITRVSENLNTVTQVKMFPGFKIIRVHYQNAFVGFRVITTTRDRLFTYTMIYIFLNVYSSKNIYICFNPPILFIFFSQFFIYINITQFPNNIYGLWITKGITITKI